MAIARGAGTEIIRAVHLESVSDSGEELIYGVQHHIYTVLSIIVQAQSVNADNDYIQCYLLGYDSLAGATAQALYIFHQDMSVTETYVWNDKFSFNGYEPNSTAVFSAAVQLLNAAQGGSADAELQFEMDNATDDFDIMVTYLDQDWS